MRIGLTGGQGVLGTRIHAALSATGNDVGLYTDDVRDASRLSSWIEDLDCVLHAAALVSVRAVDENIGDAIAVNVGGTANVAYAVSRRPACRLIHVSTCHVYACSPNPLAETGPLAPISLYGFTKLQAEAWVQRLVPDALILRVFSFFDSRQAPGFLMPSLRERVHSAPQGATLTIDGASNVRDMANAAWLADIFIRLVENRAAGVLNCGTGSATRIGDLARGVSKAMGRDDIIWREKQVTPSTTLVADTRRLAEVIGELPAFDLDASVRHFVRTSE